MTVDVFADTIYGQIALEKIDPEFENFRLFYAGWLDDGKADVMEVRGAVFRVAQRGPSKGKLAVMVEGTIQKAYVTAQEIRDRQALTAKG